MTAEEKQLFIKIYDDYGIPIAWEVGDVALYATIALPMVALRFTLKRVSRESWVC